ncbi:MAG: cupin domain-containing protein [Deltaproteobacteria bacterium]|nr:cupin domain-containing protein [Deltaproteobacteria bacterium]
MTTSRRELSQRPLDATLLTHDLREECAQLKSEPTWQTAHRNGVTLFKTPGLRVVLVAMHAGTEIPAHRAEGAIAVQVVEGRVLFTVGADEIPLEPGRLVTLQAGVAHALTAATESAFLLTIGGDAPHPAE